MNKIPFLKLRYVIILLAIVAAFFIVKVAFFSKDAKPTYITAVAKKGDVELTVLADGNIEAAKLVNVGAQVSGQIKAIHVALGDKVSKNQLVAEIDDLTQQNNLKEAEANLKNLEAQKASKVASLTNNQISYERQQSLLNKGVTAKADYDIAKATLDANKADIDSLDAQITKAQIAVDTAKLNLGYTKITSPMDGIVVAIPVEEGQTVNAVQSAPTLIKVAQLDTMTIEAQISEADVTKVEPGMPVYFTILGEPNKKYSASLVKIEPAPTSINSDTASSTSSTSTAIFYNGLFDVPNPDGKLRISMTAQVYIVLQQAKDAIIVPITAVSNIDREGNASVQVMEAKGNIISRQVKTGINNNVNIEIISGLDVGEQVIVGESSALSSSTSRRPMGMRM